jgi:oxygen-independent coproporphyrinogen-3 oxidase
VTPPPAGARRVRRTAKRRHPAAYLDPANRGRLVNSERVLDADDLVLEFAMNALRLDEGFSAELFEARTGLSCRRILPLVRSAQADGLLARESLSIRASEQGRWFLNDLIARFAPEPRIARGQAG